MKNYLNLGDNLSHQNQRPANSLSEVAHEVRNNAMNYVIEDFENPPMGFYATRRVSRKSADADAQLSDVDAQLSSNTPQHDVEMLTHIANGGVGFTKAYLEDEIPRHQRRKADYDFPNGGMENNDLFFKLTLAERTHQLEEAQQRNKSLMQGINALNSAIRRLRRELNMAKEATAEGVRIEAFCEMFLGIKDYEKAKQLFMEINYCLSKDPTWKKHSEKLQSIIEEKKNSNRAPQNVTVNGDLVYTKNVENEVNGVGKNGVGIKVING